MHLMRPLLSENFLSEIQEENAVTICASFAITCALSSKQMTLNDSSPYEGHKEAHEQNLTLGNELQTSYVCNLFYLFPLLFLAGETLCNYRNVCTAIMHYS